MGWMREAWDAGVANARAEAAAAKAPEPEPAVMAEVLAGIVAKCRDAVLDEPAQTGRTDQLRMELRKHYDLLGIDIDDTAQLHAALAGVTSLTNLLVNMAVEDGPIDHDMISRASAVAITSLTS